MNAAMKQDADVARALLEAGADPEARDIFGQTALDYVGDRLLFPEIRRVLEAAGAR
jgi:ankyrin repeat protein